jgi:hypothetical protein
VILPQVGIRTTAVLRERLQRCVELKLPTANLGEDVGGMARAFAVVRIYGLRGTGTGDAC